jgi:hypothetical protein
VNWALGRKFVHLPPGEESLEVKCLRDGSLDVCLDCGSVYSVRGSRRIKRRLYADEDGYLSFTLNREKRKRTGKPERDGSRNRWRKRRNVLVHRLVKIKAIAVAKGGSNWRSFVCDLPRAVDVNHINSIRSDNRAENLELMTERANRLRRPATDEELEELKACGW